MIADRVLAAAHLSKLYPEAKILFSGGGSEAKLVQIILVRLSASNKIIMEDKSRNMFENAKLAKIMAAPRPSDTWLLVTSAYHMPRAMGAFRAVCRVSGEGIPR